MNTCYIIAAGDCRGLDFKKDETDYVICADAGYEYALKYGIKPDLLVGDFDSYGSVPQFESIVVHPCEKDETDTHLAINIGLEKGYKEFSLHGMLGGRLDHTYANIQLLSYLCENGARGTIYGDSKITAVKNSMIAFGEENKGMISVFSFTPESKGIEISNLKYEVENFTLRSSYPMGVSNEFIGKNARISVKDGTLIIIW